MKYKSFYRYIDMEAYELCLRGEGIYIAYSVFEDWLKQSEKSLEELYVEKMNTFCCYLTNTSINGLLLLAEQWILTRGKKHRDKKIYSDYQLFNKSEQWLKSFDVK